MFDKGTDSRTSGDAINDIVSLGVAKSTIFTDYVPGTEVQYYDLSKYWQARPITGIHV